MIDYIMDSYNIIFFIIFAIFLFLNTKPANYLIRKTMEKTFSNKNTSCCTPCNNLQKKHDDKTGRIIGTCERILYFISIYFNNWNLITLVIAIKSIGRYTKLDNKEFAEKFIVGTLLSLIVSIFISYSFIAIVNSYQLDKDVKKIYQNIMDIKIVNLTEDKKPKS